MTASFGFANSCLQWLSPILPEIGGSCIHPCAHEIYRPIERPGTKFVDIAVIIPQDTFHGQRITSTGCFDYGHGQKSPAVKSFCFMFSLLWILNFFVVHSAFLFCVVLQRCGTVLQSRQFRRWPIPTHNAELESSVSVPVSWQRRWLPVHFGCVRCNHRLKIRCCHWNIRQPHREGVCHLFTSHLRESEKSGTVFLFRRQADQV